MTDLPLSFFSLFFFFGRGTSVARRDHRGGLALSVMPGLLSEPI